MRTIPFLLLFHCTLSIPAQVSLTGSELLQNAIKYHDPDSKWARFHGQIMISAERPGESERITRAVFNLPAGYFEVAATKDGNTVTYKIDKGACTPFLNGSAVISEEDAATHAIDCKRGITMKNFYSYLYGLPMKLNDPGTVIDPRVVTREFQGKSYLVLKVGYEPSVGADTWYFYFDPVTYALQVYQFFHDEAKNDGEYILLQGEELISGMRIPKIRAWYTNENDIYLGIDAVTGAVPL